ncbi:MAG: toprim domain-containing protein [Candidatus Saccharibacteria bacterium]|nr:toprim domain-containing protein [Candidatus Saccharibacteria bacterium]
MSDEKTSGQKTYPGLDRQQMRKVESERIREIPLVQVFVAMGCEQDPKDPFQWRTANRERITTGDRKKASQKFFNHDKNVGGYGAIDLAMQLGNMRYNEALTWLGSETGKMEVVATAIKVAKRQAVKSVAKETSPPPAEEKHWPQVRKYLLIERQLSGELVDKMHLEGKIYADQFRNAVFLSYDGKSAELRGTGKVTYHGLRGVEKQPFGIKAIDNAAGVAFTESAIEAASLRELGFKGYVLGFAGQSKEKAGEFACYFHEKGWTVLSAYNNDSSGETMAKNLAASLEGKQVPERMIPITKDWNDDLKIQKQQAPSSTGEKKLESTKTTAKESSLAQ